MLSGNLKSTFGTVKERSAVLVDKVKVSNVFGQSNTNNNATLTDEEQKSQKGLESPLYARLAVCYLRHPSFYLFLLFIFVMSILLFVVHVSLFVFLFCAH
jgi:hypothetical protein